MNPHPHNHPGGHRMGPEGAEWPAADSWNRCRHHRRAIDLFNAGYWWEAHEFWEELWHASPPGSAERSALQGLIQMAAALIKRATGQRAASELLQQKAFQRLGSIDDPQVLGLDLKRVLDSVESYAEGGPLPSLHLIETADRQ